MTVRPAKTQISLGIRPVWSVFAVRVTKAWVLSYLLSAHATLLVLTWGGSNIVLSYDLLMVLISPRANIAAGKERERQARDWPRGHGEPRPLQDLAEEVGTGHVVKHTTSRYFVAFLARFPEVPQDVVGMYVDRHAQYKHCYSWRGINRH